MIFDFLSLFKEQLVVLESISMDDVERAIVRSNGEGLLTHIHTVHPLNQLLKSDQTSGTIERI